MARVVVEINGERHILTKDRGAFECDDCSLVAYCNQIDGMCVQFGDASGYHFVKDKKQ